MTGTDRTESAASLPGRSTVAAFDVDGTLSVRDCMIPFLTLLAGRRRLLAGCLRQPKALVSSVIHRDRDRFKAVIVRAAYRGRRRVDVEKLGSTFAATIEAALLRADTPKRLAWHQRHGHRVVLVSASLGAYLHPLGERLGVDGVLCTEAVVETNDRYTGDLIGLNCRGAEKERRLRVWMADHGLADAELWAYGDSSGDRELLVAADHGANVKGRQIPEAPAPHELTATVTRS